MLTRRYLVALCALSFVTATAAQCDLDNLYEEENGAGVLRPILEHLLVGAISGGDSPESFELGISRTNFVCLSVGNTRGTFSSISVLVNYTCSGSSGGVNGLCPPSPATEQFDFGCTTSGEWTIGISGGSSSARDRNPLAEFTTDNRTDCSVCSGEFGKGVENFDSISHCLECPGRCEGFGQDACVDEGLNILCCNVYVEDECAEECPNNSSYVIDPNTFQCQLTCEDLGSVDKGEVEYSTDPQYNLLDERRYVDGTVASANCVEGYTAGDSINCVAGNWSDGGQLTCQIVDCGSAPKLENGELVKENGNTFGSTVEYQCNDGFVFVNERDTSICLANGTWSDVECVGEKTCNPQCQNGGTCTAGECYCSTNFTGPSCETKPCDSKCQNGGTCEDGSCVCPAGFTGQQCEECTDDNCKDCAFIDSKCVNCEDGFEPNDNGLCERLTGGQSEELCVLCIVLPIVAVILAVIAAIATAAAIYAYRKWKRAPTTKLKENGAAGLNGVARDNPLYLDPTTVTNEE